MRRIGILGGMSPESTITYYNRIVHRYIETYGNHRYPEILIFSVCFGEMIPYMETGQWAVIAEMLGNAAQTLEQGGSDFIIIATNTMHKVVDSVQAKVQIPVLSLLDVIGKECAERGIHTAGLLGTMYTMTDGFYQESLAKYGVTVLVPGERECVCINDVIFNELIAGVVNPESKQGYLNIAADLIASGAEGLILGCTEIPLLLGPGDFEVPVLDTTILHADQALFYALRK
ncbi:MAG: amino acid racemase [Anaerolineae bacterium]|nr:amino acid racemase [Anaerolineae bacterium]